MMGDEIFASVRRRERDDDDDEDDACEVNRNIDKANAHLIHGERAASSREVDRRARARRRGPGLGVGVGVHRNAWSADGRDDGVHEREREREREYERGGVMYTFSMMTSSDAMDG